MARSLAAVLSVSFSLLLTPVPGDAAVPVPAVPVLQPAWVELTPEQKQILAPLASDWDNLEPYRRKKWLGIAQRYSTLGADEQTRIQRRMREWVKLSPEDRKAAREKYKTLRNAPPEHKEALKQKWQEYKELPEEERAKLTQEAARTKPQPRPGRPVKPLAPSAPAASTPSTAPAPPPVIQPPSPPSEPPAPLPNEQLSPPTS